MASTLARCAVCGAVVQGREQGAVEGGSWFALAPLGLALLGLCLAIPAVKNALQLYNVRVERNEFVADSLRQVEAERERAEQQRIMIAHADSVVANVPRSHIARLTTAQIDSDLVALRSRSDPVAQRWIAAANKELKVRTRASVRRATH